MERLNSAFGRAAPDAIDRILLGFAPAKGQECAGDYAGAFASLTIVNRLQHVRAPWDAKRAHRQMEAILRTHAGWHTRTAAFELASELVLVASVRRSGLTLVERILASHSEVDGAHEIADLSQVTAKESERRGCAFWRWVPAVGGDVQQQLGREYLACAARRHPGKSRFTDKNLRNWYYVGALFAMLPAAHVVLVRRDPLETCLACYRTYFQRGTGFSYDLDDMAGYCADFLHLNQQGSSPALPGRQ